MAIIPIDKLPQEASKTKSSVVPLSQLPEEKSPVKEGLKMAGLIASKAISKTNPLSFESITGGFGQELGANVKRTALDMAIPSKQFSFQNQNISDLAKQSLKEAIVQGTYPGNFLLPQAMEVNARPGALLKESRKVMKQAEDLTTRILQPTTNELADSIAKGRQLPSIKRGAESISTARTFDEVVGHLRNTTKELFEERNRILQDYNSPVGTQAFDSLDELLQSATKDKVMSPSKLKILDNVYSREAEFLADNPTMDIVTAQSRKEKLQELTRPLLEKRRVGTLTGAESAELQAYDALRSGYRKAILKALPRDKAHIVDKINSKYEGLLDATELASTQAAKSIKEVPRTLLEKVASSFGLSPQYTAFRLATKEVAGLVGKTHLEKTTSKIAELRSRADTLRQLSKMATKVRATQ